MAEGDIIAIDTLEFDAVSCEAPDIIQVNDNIYLIAYRGGAGPDGWLKTVSINANGTIGAVISTLRFEVLWGFNPAVAHISGDVYIVGYTGPDNDGWLKTFSVDSDGNIGAVIDSEEIDVAYGRNFRFYHLGGTVWLIAYQNASDGWLKTLNIGNDGIFGAYVDTQNYDLILGGFPALVHISGDVFAIAYSGVDSDGWLKTWVVQSDGTIAGAMTGSLEFDGVYGYQPQMRHISGEVYAIAYQGVPSGVNGRGYIKTVTIADDGTIGAVIDTFQYTHGQKGVSVSAIIQISGNVYALAVTSLGDNGYLVTVTIRDDGQIDEPLLDELDFDPIRGAATELIHTVYGVFAVAYSGADGDGYLKTFNIERAIIPTVQTLPATEVT